MESLYESAQKERNPKQQARAPNDVSLSPPLGSVHKKRAPSVWRDLLYLFIKIGIIALVFLLLITFMFGVTRYMDSAMHPAVKDGDLIVFYRLDKQYVVGDIVILSYEGKLQAQRVVATVGDVVDITENGLYINGALQYEPDIRGVTNSFVDGVSFPITVGPGEIFVLGDNRESSTDSRIYGPVSVSDTLGKVMTILRRRSF